MTIEIGEEVTIFGKTTFNGTKVVDKPTLEIGDHSYIGYQVGIYVGSNVSIGSNVLISNNVSIFGEDGHPIDPILRRNNPPSRDSIKPVVIRDDAWICERAIVLKGGYHWRRSNSRHWGSGYKRCASDDHCCRKSCQDCAKDIEIECSGHSSY